MKYDLHIHSKYSSDGIIDPEKIVKIAIGGTERNRNNRPQHDKRRIKSKEI